MHGWLKTSMHPYVLHWKTWIMLSRWNCDVTSPIHPHSLSFYFSAGWRSSGLPGCPERYFVVSVQWAQGFRRKRGVRFRLGRPCTWVVNLRLASSGAPCRWTQDHEQRKTAQHRHNGEMQKRMEQTIITMQLNCYVLEEKKHEWI